MKESSMMEINMVKGSTNLSMERNIEEVMYTTSEKEKE
jgi:hypothetical protein